MPGKILYIWKDKYPWDVRVEKFCKTLSEAGHDVFLLCRWKGEKLKEELIDGFHISRVGYNKSSIVSEPLSINPYWRKEIRKAIEIFKPNLIIVREILLAQAAVKYAVSKDIPVIMDMAENYPAAMKLWKKYKSDIIRKFLVHKIHLPEKIERKSVVKMDGIITVCDEQIKRLNVDFGIDTDKCTVVHNTPSINSFPNNQIQDYKIKNTITFGHHGFTSDDKRIDNLIIGFDAAADFFNHIHLRIAGEGESFISLEKLVATCKHKDRIYLTGKYDYKDLHLILDSIDIGVLPYEVNDFNNYTLHNKIFDFFHTGKPIIVSPANPLKRVVSETSTGIIAASSSSESIRSAIEEIMNSNLNEFSENSKIASFIKYNWEYDSKILIEFIERYL